MATSYTKERDSADRKLKDKGAPVTLQWTTGDSVDGASGVHTPGTVKTVASWGLLKNYKRHEIDGTTIMATDRFCMLAAGPFIPLGLRPNSTMKMTVPDEFGTPVVYTIEHCEPFAPGGAVIFYRVQLRK